MKNKNSYSYVLSATLIMLLSILISSTATAQSSSPSITITQITNNSAALSPAIYGERIVYEDWVNGDYGEYGDYYGNWDIYLYNITTSEKIRVNTSESTCITPDIYDDRIVYINYSNRGHRGDVYMYNLSSNKETRITTNGLASYPQIYGDTVVWVESSDISKIDGIMYMYNLSTFKKTKVTNHARNDYKPAIYGDKIVWENFDNGIKPAGVYMYNISTSEESQITKIGSGFPDIYSDRIVLNWENQLYMYDLSTHQKTRITKGAYAFPVIYGNKIAYQDYHNGNNWNICMYDLSTQKETQITNESIGQWHPAIYGNRIVWEFPNDNYIHADIYLATISGEEPEFKKLIANFNNNVSYGHVPLSVQFNDTSEDAVEWTWDFGDGTESTLQNPTHTYSLSGEYTVNLTVKSGNLTASKTDRVMVLEKNDSSGGDSNFSSPEPSAKKESTKIPDFEIASGIICLFSVFLYKRR